MPLAPSARAAHRLLTESMWVTLNQVLFSIASVLATAFVARTASVHDAATVFAVYAVESIVITSCRGFVITAPLLRHRGATLCAGDMLAAFRTLAFIGAAALVPYADPGLLAQWQLVDGDDRCVLGICHVLRRHRAPGRRGVLPTLSCQRSPSVSTSPVSWRLSWSATMWSSRPTSAGSPCCRCS